MSNLIEEVKRILTPISSPTQSSKQRDLELDNFKLDSPKQGSFNKLLFL